MENVNVTHYDTKDYIYPLNRNTLQVKIKCEEDTVSSIYIVYWNRFKEDKRESKLEHFSLNGTCRFYSTNLTFDESAKYIRYYFIIKNNNSILYYSPYGISTNLPKKYFEYLSTNVNDIFTVPSWAKGAIGYQIFPDRFFNGNVENDPALVEKWGESPNRENFFGGDLRGIIEKFSHIKDLGVEIIYLTPIFHSPSNHKYDTIDYFKVDPSFGDIEDLKELVRVCTRYDMKLILDGVFNHISYYSPQFQDVIHNGKQSPYWDWFYIEGDVVNTDILNYECVGYYKWMPKLNYSNQEVREHFLRVGEYWIKEVGIDGWRLDVADEVDFTFWQEFRKKMKSIEREILLIGETWKNGSDLIKGDQMDTIMNYRFRDAIIEYFADRIIQTKSFMDRIENFLFDYPVMTHNVLYNLLDSHDTARYLTTCNGDLDRFKLSLIFQMTFPGMPFVYYGDEIGMRGETDPDCRRTMAWDSINGDVLEFYKKIINIRKNSDALKYGSFKHINTNTEVYSFIRQYENESVVVFINNSENDYTLFSELSKAKENIHVERINEGNNLESSRSFIVHLPANNFEIISIVRKEAELKINRIGREILNLNLLN